MRHFLVIKWVKSISKDIVAQILVSKTKVPYKVLYNATLGFYCLQCLPFLGFSNSRDRCELICGQDGEYSIRHGDYQSFIWAIPNNCHYARAISS